MTRKALSDPPTSSLEYRRPVPIFRITDRSERWTIPIQSVMPISVRFERRSLRAGRRVELFLNLVVRRLQERLRARRLKMLTLPPRNLGHERLQKSPVLL